MLSALLKTSTFWTSLLKFAVALAVHFGALPMVSVDLSGDPATQTLVQMAANGIALWLAFSGADKINQRRTILRSTLPEIPAEK